MLEYMRNSMEKAIVLFTCMPSSKSRLRAVEHPFLKVWWEWHLLKARAKGAVVKERQGLFCLLRCFEISWFYFMFACAENLMRQFRSHCSCP